MTSPATTDDGRNDVEPLTHVIARARVGYAAQRVEQPVIALWRAPQRRAFGEWLAAGNV